MRLCVRPKAGGMRVFSDSPRVRAHFKSPAWAKGLPCRTEESGGVNRRRRVNPKNIVWHPRLGQWGARHRTCCSFPLFPSFGKWKTSERLWCLQTILGGDMIRRNGRGADSNIRRQFPKGFGRFAWRQFRGWCSEAVVAQGKTDR